ncbi:MAG: glycyl-radical enzyme activating protein [Proteobacteria bacterium]|nr:glycyl-radical enzyme activating protein [Pseudomonadota bacterium]
MKPLSANIFAIKRYALHDGPNIRTTVFFKGCPLACWWCHNPEGIDFALKVLFLAKKCVGCGECVDYCPEKALQLTRDGVRRTEDLCTSCSACVAICPALAHEATGQRMAIAEIITEIKKDLPFFDQSGGGVTFSGGEPLSQPESLLALLQACGQLGLHRAVDTSGFARVETLLDIARNTELFLYDIKHMDSAIHKRFTGVANDLILSNLKALGDNGHAIRVRIPLILGVNDDEKNIHATGAFVARCNGVQGIDILSYHPSATAKYRKLGESYKGAALAAPTKAHMAQIADALKKYIVDVNIGG